jgi:hypothetical protein
MDPFVKKINVEQKEIVVTNTINNIIIRIINMKIKSYVNLSVMTMENNKLLSNYTFHLEGDDYNNWGNDDDYLIQYVLDKLHLTPK